MLKRVLVACAMLMLGGFPGPVAAQKASGADQWIKIADAETDYSRNEMTVDLSSTKGGYKAIRFKSDRRVVFTSIDAIYAGGHRKITGRFVFSSGRLSAPMRLGGKSRLLQRLDMRHKKGLIRSGKIKLEIWGLQDAAGAEMAPAPPKVADGKDIDERAVEPPRKKAADAKPNKKSKPAGGSTGSNTELAEEEAAKPSGGAPGAPDTYATRSVRKPVYPPTASVTVAPPAPPPAAAEKKLEEYDVMPVYYGTDRKNTGDSDKPVYTDDGAGALQLGRALVTIPKNHEMPNIERPWSVRLPYFGEVMITSEDPKKHFTVKELKQMSRSDFLALVRTRLAASNRYKDQALVFIHGYNNNFRSAVFRTAQIAYDLRFDGAPFLYSWPASEGFISLTNYNHDLTASERSRRYLKEFLQMVSKESGAKSVSIIAHSMGNRALLEVLKDLKTTAPDTVSINQIILAAPDVDIVTFRDLAEEFKGIARGVTLYASSNDRAMDASRQLAGADRAGDVPDGGPVIVDGIDTIDVSAISTDTFALNHSTYAQTSALMTDIELLLRTGERPPKNRIPILEEVMKALPSGTQRTYWRYPKQ